jgi:hypothetical protein
MTLATFDATGGPTPLPGSTAYVPGQCNIGQAEIAGRRRAGHVGVVATIGLLGILIVIGAPPLARLLVALPAAVAASGYLQARLRFCAAFGARGVYNFDQMGSTIQIAESEARRRDRARATQIGIASGLIGLAVGIAAVLLPV